MGPKPIGGMPSVGIFLRDPSQYLRKFRTENSERLGRQARLGFEPGTSRLPVLSATIPPLVGRQALGILCCEVVRIDIGCVSTRLKHAVLEHTANGSLKRLNVLLNSICLSHLYYVVMVFLQELGFLSMPQ